MDGQGFVIYVVVLVYYRLLPMYRCMYVCSLHKIAHIPPLLRCFRLACGCRRQRALQHVRKFQATGVEQSAATLAY